MPNILIVGAGQAGLMLALGLQQHGSEVTLMTDRTAEEIRGGRVMSTQLLWESARCLERDLGLALWEGAAPDCAGIGMTMTDPRGQVALEWCAPLAAPAQSVDQRVKMATWLELFAERGGRVVVHGVTVSDLDWYARRYDLVVVAAGRGELVSLFDRDEGRSPYREPQRALSATYLHGVRPREHDPWPVCGRCNTVAGAGEIYLMPSYTHTGPCDIVLFEALPGGPMDVFGSVRDPDEHVRRTTDLLREHAPWEYERVKDAELTDPGGVLAGRYAPTVRRPVAELPSGGLVLGIGDVVVSNDPITGQGANLAARAATHYLRAVLDHGEGPFDRAWMNGTFESFWEHARHATRWTNAMLAPPPAFLQRLLGLAARYPAIAQRFVDGFDDPSDFQHWFFDEEAADAYLAEVVAAAGR